MHAWACSLWFGPHAAAARVMSPACAHPKPAPNVSHAPNCTLSRLQVPTKVARGINQVPTKLAYGVKALADGDDNKELKVRQSRGGFAVPCCTSWLAGWLCGSCSPAPLCGGRCCMRRLWFALSASVG